MFSGTFERVTFVNKKIDLENYGDIRLYRDVMEIIERANSHQDSINRVLHNSYAIIRDIGIQKNQYVYEYQVALISYYTPVSELEIIPENIYGWEEFFALQTPVIFIVITFIGIFANIFIVEKRTRIVNILNICRNGGFKLVTSKLLTIIIFSVSITYDYNLMFNYFKETGRKSTKDNASKWKKEKGEHR
jgi:hypothetical protein